MLQRSALRPDCTAVLAPGSCRTTRYALARCAQTDAASMRTKRAAARRPRGCAPRRRTNHPCRVPPGARSWLGWLSREHREHCCEDGAGQDAMRLRGAEKVSLDTNGPEDRLCLANGWANGPARPARPGPWPRAQRASTSDLARLFERSAQRAASYAPGQGCEHRRAVGTADRRTEASRPALHRLRHPADPARMADAEGQLCAASCPRSLLK